MFPPELSLLLKQFFPTLRLERISWYGRLPWFVAPLRRISGITLPHALRPGKTAIYLRHWAPSDPDWVALVIHEAYHALQIQDAESVCTKLAPRWSIWHPFVIAYLSSWTKHGYRHHPLEIPAYAFEADCLPWLDDHTNPEALDDAMVFGVEHRVRVPRSLICRASGFNYPDAVWRIFPAVLLALPAGVLRALAALFLSPWSERFRARRQE